MADVDILSSKKWNDLLFEGRNKNYGAYQLRATTGKRNMWALLSLLIIFVCIGLAVFFTGVIERAVAELGNDQAMELQNVDAQEEEEEEVFHEESKPDEAPMETVTEMASSIQFTVPEITDTPAEDKELIAQQKAKSLADLQQIAVIGFGQGVQKFLIHAVLVDGIYKSAFGFAFNHLRSSRQTISLALMYS